MANYQELAVLDFGLGLVTNPINALIVDLANAKQVLNQVIDDHQANGLLQ